MEAHGPAEEKPEAVDIKPFINNPWFSLAAPFDPKPEPHSAPSTANDDSCGSAFEPDDNSSYFQFFKGDKISTALNEYFVSE